MLTDQNPLHNFPDTRRDSLKPRNRITDVLLREGRLHRLDCWVLFPVADEYVEILSANHQTLSSIYRVTTAPPEVTKFALDKRLTYGHAAELGISTPWTSIGSSLADLEAEDIHIR